MYDSRKKQGPFIRRVESELPIGRRASLDCLKIGDYTSLKPRCDSDSGNSFVHAPFAKRAFVRLLLLFEKALCRRVCKRFGLTEGTCHIGRKTRHLIFRTPKVCPFDLILLLYFSKLLATSWLFVFRKDPQTAWTSTPMSNGCSINNQDSFPHIQAPVRNSQKHLLWMASPP